jgi:hypothetical protein
VLLRFVLIRGLQYICTCQASIVSSTVRVDEKQAEKLRATADVSQTATSDTAIRLPLHNKFPTIARSNGISTLHLDQQFKSHKR